MGFTAISTNLGVTMNIGAGDDATGGYNGKYNGVPCPEAVGNEAEIDSAKVKCVLKWYLQNPAKFAKLSWMGRLLDRVYRSGWAPGLYYMIEIWWKREFFPNKTHMPTRRPIFFKDSLLVTVFGVLWIAAIVAAAVLH